MRMKPLSLLRIGAALALAGAMTDASALLPERFFAKTAPSVWKVIAYDADGIAFSLGSGVVIAKETLLTNCHVLAKAKRIAVKQDNASYDAKLQYIDLQRDMCQITARNLPAPPVAIGDSDKLVVGQHVLALGNPRGLELTLSDGLVSPCARTTTATWRRSRPPPRYRRAPAVAGCLTRKAAWSG